MARLWITRRGRERSPISPAGFLLVRSSELPTSGSSTPALLYINRSPTSHTYLTPSRDEKASLSRLLLYLLFLLLPSLAFSSPSHSRLHTFPLPSLPSATQGSKEKLTRALKTRDLPRRGEAKDRRADLSFLCSLINERSDGRMIPGSYLIVDVQCAQS